MTPEAQEPDQPHQYDAVVPAERVDPVAAPPRRPAASRTARRNPRRRTSVYIGAGVLAFLLLGGGAVAVASSGGGGGSGGGSGNESAQAQPAAKARASASPSAGNLVSDKSEATNENRGVNRQTVVVTRSIPFATTTVKDPSLPHGARKVRTQGVAGVVHLTYEITYKYGMETSRKLLAEKVVQEPVNKVVAVGVEAVGPTCDPHYLGACVPIASDVDCEGEGDGPEYVKDEVEVVGKDVYELDGDGDGFGCNA